MANEIQTIGATGKTLYAIIRSATAQVWRTDTHVFEAFTGANYATYVLALTEQSTTGYYAGTFPTQIGAGTYSIDVRQQVGGSAAISDLATNAGLLLWSGAAEVQIGLSLPVAAAGAAGGLPTATNASGQVVASSVVGAVASVTAGVTVSTNNDKTGYTASTVQDKTGYALTAGEHILVSGTDVPAALTAQGYTTARATYLDTLNGLVAAIWGAATRTLSAFGFAVTVGGYSTGQDPATQVLATPANKLATTNSGQVDIDMAQAVPRNPTTGTTGDALLAAESDGFGAEALSGSTLTLKDHAGTTTTRTFTVATDSSGNPVSRT